VELRRLRRQRHALMRASRRHRVQPTGIAHDEDRVRADVLRRRRERRRRADVGCRARAHRGRARSGPRARARAGARSRSGSGRRSAATTATSAAAATSSTAAATCRRVGRRSIAGAIEPAGLDHAAAVRRTRGDRRGTAHAGQRAEVSPGQLAKCIESFHRRALQRNSAPPPFSRVSHHVAGLATAGSQRVARRSQPCAGEALESRNPRDAVGCERCSCYRTSRIRLGASRS
jgi:hypothetical protein